MSRIRTARLQDLHETMQAGMDTSLFDRDTVRAYTSLLVKSVQQSGKSLCKRACIAMAHTMSSGHAIGKQWAGLSGKSHRRYCRNTVTHEEHKAIMRHHRTGKLIRKHI
jgi:PIN domain nuclease of toxin-antitoxin system